ncbi:MAG: hypothetical protein AAGH78_15920 [Cyanobacteria bacterium P01_H01_bin.58]
MPSDIPGLLTALKKWRKSVKKLRKKGKPLETREQKVAKARQQVLKHLGAESVTDDIDGVIHQAIAPDGTPVEAVRETLIKHPVPIIGTELRTIHPLAVSRKELETLIQEFLQTPDDEKPVADSEELRKVFVQLSLTIPEAYKATSELSRKQKKRRKRDLTLGTLNTAIGIGLIAGNSQLGTNVADYSYLLGGNALMLAMRNIVGTLMDASEDEG